MMLDRGEGPAQGADDVWASLNTQQVPSDLGCRLWVARVRAAHARALSDSLLLRVCLEN